MEAMRSEYESMKSFNVFTEMELSQVPKEQQAEIIDSRWVHRRKPDGTVRSRLVCRGFKEIIEKDEAYAATPTFSTFKMILSHALNSNHAMYFGDISTAFLHADVLQPIFAKPPKGYQKDSKQPKVWQLHKAMCGLKSAPRSWQTHITAVLQGIGLQQMKSDSCLFRDSGSEVFVIVYVDDLFITGVTKEKVQDVISGIAKQVLLKEVGWLSMGGKVSYLGREINHLGNAISIGVNSRYIQRMV